MVSILGLKMKNLLGNLKKADRLDQKEKAYLAYVTKGSNYYGDLSDEMLVNRTILELVFVLRKDFTKFYNAANPFVDQMNDAILDLEMKQDDPAILNRYTFALRELSSLKNSSEQMLSNITNVEGFHARERHERTKDFDEFCAHVIRGLKELHGGIHKKIRDIN